MKVHVTTPYETELEKPIEKSSGYFLHQHSFGDSVTIQQNGQMFTLVWDNDKNALRIISDKNLTIIPSSTNGILIQDGGK